MLQITDLAAAPRFCATIAERGWHAWWTGSGTSLAEYRRGIEAIAAAPAFPAGFVAHDGPAYAGSVLLIERDLDERPNLTPWIAALWVEPAVRRQGVAAALIDRARSAAKALGYPEAFLYAEKGNTGFYLARGFRLLERDVGGLNVFSIPT